jgi:hypothetical protein
MTEDEARSFKVQLAGAVAVAGKRGEAVIGYSWADGKLVPFTAKVAPKREGGQGALL